MNGTGNLRVAIAAGIGRDGFTPSLELAYDSGNGNGPFGVGWSVSVPRITRKTDKGLPVYEDRGESDVFILSGLEDLVPAAGPSPPDRVVDGKSYRVRRYRPRVESDFQRVERWTTAGGDEHWRTVSRDNVTTEYGRTAASRISDPTDATRVFSWLASATYDARGHALVYTYKSEDSTGVATDVAHERNRTAAGRSAQRYLKRVQFGNVTSRLVEPSLAAADWLFEIVFDYGDHDAEAPAPADSGAWSVRLDPFSSQRSGFEVRTYRLCRRVLVFHHFPDEPGVGPDCLVRSLELGYREEATASFLTSITQRGHQRLDGGATATRAMPPIELDYSRPTISEDLRELDGAALVNLPEGLVGKNRHFVDLDGEGIAGVLTEAAGGWFYKANLGDGRFGDLTALTHVPAATLEGGAELLDLGGDGRLDLALLGGPTPGHYERTDEGGWDRFVPFTTLPRIRWGHSNLRMVDLDGDGLADVLVTEDDALIWHRALGQPGFAAARRTAKPRDEERGPVLVFADGTESIYLADMCGDGLADLVRVRNGEVAYWPNLGYGRFGAKVTMDDAPLLDRSEGFDQRRVRLADLDGSGTSDLVYLGADGVDLYFNQSGNRFAAARRLAQFPLVTDPDDVTLVDLLGNGTPCLVWSSSLPGAARAPLRYLDLMGGQKPHLLVSVANNLGSETHVGYVSSTRFYLADKAAGQPWVTRLPFPVHVVERVEVVDRVSGNRFVTRNAYHHGFFDGVEREFRGFAMVERWDTEELAVLEPEGGPTGDIDVDASSYVAPVLTRSWYHTGAFVVPVLPDPLLDAPPDAGAELDADEAREAARALKGSLLRQEVYALDGSPRSAHPYAVSERSYTVARLQPRGTRRHAVFHVHAREQLDRRTERDPADPAIRHTATLVVDDYGTVLQTATASYGRVPIDPTLPLADRAVQATTLVTCEISQVTNAVDSDDDHRAPLVWDHRRYQMTGVRPGGGRARFSFAELAAAVVDATETAYEATPSGTTAEKRLVGHERTIYRRDDLGADLAPGVLEALALPADHFTLALTSGLVAAVFPHLVDDAMLGGDCGYVHLAGGSDWWSPSGRVWFSPGAADSPAQELDFARRHFFAIARAADPFGNLSSYTHDRYDLLVDEVRDAAGNLSTAGERDVAGNRVRGGNDYRTLQPWLLMDANRNRTAVAFDALGMIVGAASMGKPEETLGDSLDGFVANLDEATIAAHFADPFAAPAAVLQGVRVRFIHDLGAYLRTRTEAQPQPSALYSLTRETHGDVNGRVQHGFAYSDGFSRPIQRKVQAEPGPLAPGLPDVARRWVGAGWTVYDQKGKPVRKYEPFFSDHPRFELARRVGVSATQFYDPIERPVATLHPEHTYEKQTFGSWRNERWDVNDTSALADPRDDPDAGDFFRRLADDAYLPTWAARRAGGALGPDEAAAAAKTVAHAGTPTVDHLDSLGRAFLSLAWNRVTRGGVIVEELSRTRFVLDISGRQLEVVDALGRSVVRQIYDLTGRRIHQAGSDAGARRLLADVRGKPVYGFDDRGHRFRTVYDPLRRSIAVHLSENGAAETLIERTVYGESRPDPTAVNLRTRVAESYDGAGRVENERYDFKGNLTRTVRTLARAYAATLDWSAPVALEAETFAQETTHDALDRPVTFTAPDDSVVTVGYNEANLLERIDLARPGAAVVQPILANVDYDARGQRTRVAYGNGVVTRNEYDPVTFRLVRIATRRRADAFPDDCPDPTAASCGVQDLRYTFDAIGNVVARADGAQQTIYFRNRRVEPSAAYGYDAVYRLVEASGREHLGQSGAGLAAPVPGSASDAPRVRLAHPGDGNVVGRYRQRYLYDEVGNLVTMAHAGTDPSSAGWTRTLTFAEPSRLSATQTGNRITSSQVGAETPQPFVHDAHGNMTAMPGLPLLRWDHRDRLVASAQQVVTDGTPETTYHVYDGVGQRVRKVTERQAAAGATPTRKTERIYVGPFELDREYGADGVGVTLERATLHVLDGKRRVALVETVENGDPLVRYQHDDHIGCVGLELDASGRIISYEEYYPYGGTAYQAVRSQVESRKRYRYGAKERDEETGLSYHGARHYVPWLGRWTSVDPAGLDSGLNAYEYGYDNPVKYVDTDGRQATANQQRFTSIFNEENVTHRDRAHVETLIRSFTDTQITDQAATVNERLQSILVLTGGQRQPNPGSNLGQPAPHFNATLTGIGTGRGPTQSGDLGFRRELRDSVRYVQGTAQENQAWSDQHRGSSNQVGHFLTAVDIGFQIGLRQDAISGNEQFMREHPILGLWLHTMGGNAQAQAIAWGPQIELMLRAAVGHELIPDGAGGSLNGVGPAVRAPSVADISNFESRHLDQIRLNTIQNGNSYQDLLLTWIGVRFGENVARGRITTNAEAARWLRMMLTDTDLTTVARTDPFYQDAQQVNGLLQQFRAMQQRQPQ